VRALGAAAILLGACASPPAVPGPEPAAAAAEEPRPLEPTGRCAYCVAAPAHVVELAERLRALGPERLTAGWPRRSALPKDERRYLAAHVCEDLASDGWHYDVLVDSERPTVLWVRTTGTIAGIREYRGPADVASVMAAEPGTPDGAAERLAARVPQTPTATPPRATGCGVPMAQ
jgi:hypothetical protein